jgi:hypothetical protein
MAVAHHHGGGEPRRVLIEHGGFGAEAAAPAPREIDSAFLHVR